MLSKLRIVNFRSIVDLTLDFSYAEGKAPNGYKEMSTLPFLTAPNGERLVPCMAFFGANASGKSNIIKALLTLNTISQGLGNKLLFDPNILDPAKPTTMLQIDFFVKKNTYQYTIVYDGTRICEEELSHDGIPIYTIQDMIPFFSKQLSTETYSVEKLAEIFKVESSDGNGKQTTAFLARIGNGYRGLNKNITEVYDFFRSDLLAVSNTKDFPLPFAIDLISKNTNQDKGKVLKDVVDIIKRLDIDIEDIKIKPRILSETEQAWIDKEVPAHLKSSFTNEIISFHKTVTGDIIAANFHEMESTGTIRLAGLIALLLFALQTGATLFIDEFDCSLHPLLVRELISMFKKKRHNTTNAQLFFTTHNTDILDDSILRISEVATLRKIAGKGTIIKSLVDLKREEGADIRNVTNFRRQYLDGFYSGIPYPAL